MAKVIGAQIKIKLVETPEVSKGGIFIAQKKDFSEIACNVGVVQEIGPLAFKGLAENPDDKDLFKVGDMVYFTKYAGFRINKKESKVVERIIDFRDVKAIVEDDDDLYGF
jgi:co-chaperonin GroES (HSP10)